MMARFQLAFLGMKFLLAFLLLGTLSASARASAPDWFSDYLKTFPVCERELLCAVGDGDTLTEAMNQARLEVANYFQAKIDSKSQTSSSSQQKGTTAGSGTFAEWSNKTISVESSELISGLEIKKQEQLDGHVYVLMGLERAKSAVLLKEKILALDTENAQLMALDSRFTYPRLLKNLDLIDLYNDRYTLLSESKIQLKVKKETVKNKILKLAPMKTALITRGKKLPARLNHILIDLLSPLKVVVVSQKYKPPYTLRGEVVTQEQYLKVDGFKKLNVIYKLELLNANGAVVGKMSTFSQQVARNVEHAIEKAMPDIQEALQNNLDQLSSK